MRVLVKGGTAIRGQVSMESGLEDRNNLAGFTVALPPTVSLNGVRPRRPEQYDIPLS